MHILEEIDFLKVNVLAGKEATRTAKLTGSGLLPYGNSILEHLKV